ncbi:MAG: MsnO8 family LLM class oxidoreductase, partial [Fibrobacterota bacterium]
VELLEYLDTPVPGQTIQAVPGTGSHVPVWILGSSLYGAQLAAKLGLPYAFASHFAPGDLLRALDAYRDGFCPSRHLEKPHAMVGINAAVADTDAGARRLFTSPQQSFTNLLRGTRGRLQPPVDEIDSYWSGAEMVRVSAMLSCSFVGSQATVKAALERFVQSTQADELMVVSAIYDHAARLRSYELLAQLAQ